MSLSKRSSWCGTLLLISLLVLLGAGLGVGCSEEAPATDTTTASPTETVSTEADVTEDPATTEAPTTTETPDDPFAQKWGDTVDLGDLLITVEAPADDTANLDEMTREFMLEPGEKAMYCMVTIENTGDEPYSYNTLSFTIYDTEGMNYDTLMNPTSQPDLGSGDLLPGRKAKGVIGYTMPEAAEVAYVDFQRDIMSSTEASWGN